MEFSLPPVRRIVTGHDSSGRAVIVEDGPAPVMRTVAQRPGYRVTQLWMTRDAPAPIDAPDASAAISGVAPPPRGTVVRMIDFPPESGDAAERERAARASFASLFADADKQAGQSRHPAMHRTETIDYAIVISGEITALLDEGETVMHAGDILIQRGTNHAWANRSGAMCRIAFILIDGAR